MTERIKFLLSADNLGKKCIWEKNFKGWRDGRNKNKNDVGELLYTEKKLKNTFLLADQRKQNCLDYTEYGISGEMK